MVYGLDPVLPIHLVLGMQPETLAEIHSIARESISATQEAQMKQYNQQIHVNSYIGHFQLYNLGTGHY